MRLAFRVDDSTSYSLAQCAKFCGFEIYFWNGTVPIYDVIDIFKPEIIFGNVDTHNQVAEIAKQKIKLIEFKQLGPFSFGSALLFKQHPFDEDYSSDMFYLSDAKQTDGGRFKLISKYALDNKKKLKIVGKEKVDLPQYLGVLTQQTTLDKLIASTKIIIDFNGSMVYNAALSKKFCLSFTKNDTYPSFTSDNTIGSNLKHYIGSAREREELITIAYDKVIKHHTEFHVLSHILKYFKEELLAKQVEDALCKIS